MATVIVDETVIDVLGWEENIQQEINLALTEEMFFSDFVAWIKNNIEE